MDAVETARGLTEARSVILKERKPEKLLLTIPETAYTLGLSRTSVYELITTAGLPSLRLAGRRLIPAAELETWLAAERRRQADENSVVY